MPRPQTHPSRISAVWRSLSVTLLLGAGALAQTTATPAPTSQSATGSVTAATASGITTPSTGLSLQAAVLAALQNAAEVRTAQANLDKANAANKAAQTDPSVLVAAKLSASNAASLAQAQLRGAQLSTLQSTIAAHTTLLAAQENVAVDTAQVAADQKSLQVAQTKAEVGNATAIDVQNARNTLAASTQALADAQAQVTLAAARLNTLTGQNKTQASGPVSAPPLTQTLAQLQANLGQLASLVAANNDLASAQLAVKLADNDYTPARTLQDARIALANAQRAQATAGQSASQTLASAYQNAQNAAQLLSVAISREDAANKSYQQDSARLQSGTISAVDLQATQLNLKKAQYSRLSAQISVLTSLAALSVAAGQNLTGVGGTL